VEEVLGGGCEMLTSGRGQVALFEQRAALRAFQPAQT